MERHGAVRIRDQFGREVNFTSWGEEPPRGAFPGGGRGRGNGGGGGKQGKANKVITLMQTKQGLNRSGHTYSQTL